MTKPYTPKGKIVPVILAVKADPERYFTVPEVIVLLAAKKVGASLLYALRAGEIFRGRVDGQTVYRGMPFEDGALPIPRAQVKIDRIKTTNGWPTPPDDIRIPKVVPGWTPPKMVCVRMAA